MTKPWQRLDELEGRVHGNLGVFQLADAAGEVLYIGYAGGKSLFGLKGEIAQRGAEVDGATQVRWEITTAYLSRFRELMMVHIADHEAPPPCNPPVTLGKLSPA